MSTIKKTVLATAICLFIWSFANGQSEESYVASNIANDDFFPTFHKFKNPQKYAAQEIKTQVFEHLNCSPTNDFLLEKIITDKFQIPNSKSQQISSLKNQNPNNNFSHFKYQQYHKGVRVEHAIYTMHTRNDRLYAMSGEFVRIDESFNIEPQINEYQALQFALNQINATRYKWQSLLNESHIKIQTDNPNATYYPQGELVIIQNPQRENRDAYRRPVLAYKFDIYATQPLSRAHVYVHAHTGELIHQNPIIKHVEGVCHTKYSGIKELEVEQIATDTFRLRDDSRGNGIITLNLDNNTNSVDAIDFIDDDNDWSEWDNAAQDNAAQDAHYGAQQSYDFFEEKFGRNSYDGAGAEMRNYVHFGNNQINAFWDGEGVFYGDGNTEFSAHTSLDIVAHEFAHALCDHTAGLEYFEESGALNEGFSDIWAACIEHFAEPQKAIWHIGEDLSTKGDILRSMSDPNSKNHPDTYGGEYWYTDSGNYGGVHTNSSVLNHWFYLLSEGGEGSNDYNDVYEISPIGMDAAAQIAYRTETVYLSPTSNFSSARVMSIQAAEDLFGACSQEVISTTDAWYAVGVGGRSGCESGENYCHSQGNNHNYEWIAGVTIGDFTKYSAASSYSNFTNYVIDLTIGDSMEVQLTPGYAGTPYMEQYHIWIDFNADGDFTDAGEEVFTSNPTNTFAEGKIYIPEWASDTTRMRVSMRFENTPPVCGTFDYGEVEDYTVRFVQAPEPTCDDGIQNGEEEGVDCGGNCMACLPENPYCEAAATYSFYQWIDYVGTSATNGNSSGNNDGYRDFSNIIFSITRGTTQPIFFSSSNSNYDFYWHIFIDFNQDEDYDEPSELVISGTSASGGIVSANASIPAGAALGATRMRVILSSDEEVAPCGTFLHGEVEDYMVFMTNSFINDPTVWTEYSGGENDNIISKTIIFPNPAVDVLQVQLPDLEGLATARIYDWSGRLISQFEFEDKHQVLNVADWQTGMYLIQVEWNGEVFSEKILKQ